MKYFVLVGVCSTLANLVWAEQSADQWDGWDELPADVLNLGGDLTAKELSRQLDTLIKENQDSEDLDLLLELWLEQAALAPNERTIPLQSLMGPVDEPHPVPGASGSDADKHQSLLQQLLQSRPPGDIVTPGSQGGPPIELPTGNGSANGSGSGGGNNGQGDNGSGNGANSGSGNGQGNGGNSGNGNGQGNGGNGNGNSQGNSGNGNGNSQGNSGSSGNGQGNSGNGNGNSQGNSGSSGNGQGNSGNGNGNSGNGNGNSGNGGSSGNGNGQGNGGNNGNGNGQGNGGNNGKGNGN